MPETDPGPIEIVTLRGDDDAGIAAARELFLEYQSSLGIDLCFQGFQREVAELPGSYAPPEGLLLLARHGGNAVACVAMRPLSDGSAEMKRLYVRPAGRGHGLGRRLVDLVIARAKELGHRRICLDTLPSMATAQALYLELGFQDIPPYRDNPVEGARFLALDLERD